MQDNNILGFLIGNPIKKSDSIGTKTVTIDGQQVEVKMYAETKKREKTYGRIKGKSVHDAVLTQHMSEDEISKLGSKK